MRTHPSAGIRKRSRSILTGWQTDFRFTCKRSRWGMSMNARALPRSGAWSPSRTRMHSRNSFARSKTSIQASTSSTSARGLALGTTTSRSSCSSGSASSTIKRSSVSTSSTFRSRGASHMPAAAAPLRSEACLIVRVCNFGRAFGGSASRRSRKHGGTSTSRPPQRGEDGRRVLASTARSDPVGDVHVNGRRARVSAILSWQTPDRESQASRRRLRPPIHLSLQSNSTSAHSLGIRSATSLHRAHTPVITSGAASRPTYAPRSGTHHANTSTSSSVGRDSMAGGRRCSARRRARSVRCARRTERCSCARRTAASRAASWRSEAERSLRAGAGDKGLVGRANL
jgi:hypothetical protein